MIIKNGTAINPYTNKAEIKNLKIKGRGTIDASGLWVVPGLIDLHVHFRDPGLTHKEDITTGLRSAAAGGFTTVCTMANTSPVTDSVAQIKYQIKKAAKAKLGNLLPISAVTVGMDGTHLTDFSANKKAGAPALSEDGKTVTDENLFSKALQNAAAIDMPILDHCDDVLGEELIAERDIALAIKNNARLHICHVSLAKTVELIRTARKTHSHLITAEAAPHHFSLTRKDATTTNAKMSPPLREESDRLAIIEGLKDGTISVIATDHAPHTAEEKSVPFEKAPNGIIGLETAVALAITNLYHTGHLDAPKLISCLTSAPANVLGITPNPSDITIIDPNYQWTVDSHLFHSKSKNQPYDGMQLRGKVMYTICNGKLIYKHKQS